MTRLLIRVQWRRLCQNRPRCRLGRGKRLITPSAPTQIALSEKLGLRGARTSYLLLDQAPGDLDVVAGDGVVTMILGLHM